MESNFRRSELKNLLKQTAFCKINSHMPIGLYETSVFKVLLSSLHFLAKYS